MDFDIDILGLKEMDENLRTLGAELGAKTLRGALRDAAKPMEDYMNANAPESEAPRTIRTRKGERVEIRPGFLKSRIKRRTQLNKRGTNTRKFGKDGVAVVQVGVFKVPYVVQVEYGTSKSAAHPFIRRAESVAGESIQIFLKRLRRRTDLAARKLKRSRVGL